MDNISNFKSMFTYIEENIDKNIDVETLAQKTGVSVYEFRRIFSFLVGIPIGEYLRKRKLSKAAFDLIGGLSVTEVSQRYGYDAPSSFSRAFKEFHGFAPCQIEHETPKMFTKADVEMSLSRGVEIPYVIIDEDAFTISGHFGYSDASDTECCECVWDAFYDEQNAAIHDACSEQIYAAYFNEPNAVSCLIGARGTTVDGAVTQRIPAAKWACFKMIGADHEEVSAFYCDVLLKWFQSCGCERDDTLPTVEVYPADMEADDFEWEIRIPVKAKEA